MVDLSIRRSRRLCGISPTSVKPSPRSCRSNFFGSFELVLGNAIDMDPSLRALISQGELGLVHNLDSNALVLARVLEIRI